MKFTLKYLIVLLVAILFESKSYGQNPHLIKVDSLYKEPGVIFPENYQLSIIIANIDKRFTPSVEEVAQADKIFLDSFNVTNKSNPISANAMFIADPKKHFSRYIRQYVGYYDLKGHKNILIHLLENNKPRKIKRRIGDRWKEDFVIIFAQPMPFGILTYRVDLTERKSSIDF